MDQGKWPKNSSTPSAQVYVSWYIGTYLCKTCLTMLHKCSFLQITSAMSQFFAICITSAAARTIFFGLYDHFQGVFFWKGVQVWLPGGLNGRPTNTIRRRVWFGPCAGPPGNWEPSIDQKSHYPLSPHPDVSLKKGDPLQNVNHAPKYCTRRDLS